MYNLYTKFVKILEICKQYSKNIVNKYGDIHRLSTSPKFSDLEVITLYFSVKTESIGSKK